MLGLTKFLIFLTFSIWASCAFSAPNDIGCPSSLQKQVVFKSSSVDGWDLQVNEAIKFSGIGFMGGPIGSGLWLKFNDFSETKSTTTQIWTFAGNREGNWIVCFYGADDSVTLSKKLPDEINQCTVVFDKTKRSRSKPKQLSCK